MLICKHCTKPIKDDELPLVTKWTSDKSSPAFPRQVPQEAVHINCDLISKGKTPRAVATISAPIINKAPSLPKEPSTDHLFKSQGDPYHGQHIFKLKKANPRKEGTKGWESYNLLQDGMTFDEYKAAGGRKNDLQWDLDHKFVELRSDNVPVRVSEEKAAVRPQPVKVKQAAKPEPAPPAKGKASKQAPKPSAQKPTKKVAPKKGKK